jgi:hypothetical protein
VKDYPVDQPSYQRLQSTQVPESWRFPSMFYGDGNRFIWCWLIIGVRGHRFHVFNEPYYYAEPEVEYQHHQ